LPRFKPASTPRSSSGSACEPPTLERPQTPASKQRRPYQAEGAAWLRQIGRGLIADEPGLGKSRQLIEAAEGDTAVLAPAGVLNVGTWDDEIAAWGDDPSRFTQTAYTSMGVREKVGEFGSRPTKILIPELRRPFGTLIADEVHNTKGRKTSWTLATHDIKSERAYLATGTPFPNWADEMFTPLQLIFPEQARPGQRLGSYWRWAGEWFDTKPNRFSKGMPVVGDLLACNKRCLERPAYDPCEHYLEFAEVNWQGHFLRRLRSDVLTDLPPLTEQTVHVPMTPAQRSAYRSLKRDFVAWAEDGTEIAAWNDAALHVKLDQLTTGLFTLDPTRPPKESESGKLATLVQDLGGRSRPTFVVAHYQATLDGAAAFVAKKLGLKVGVIHGGVPKARRHQIVRQFQDEKLDALFGSIETVGEGITLTQADMCIFLEKSFKPFRNEQAMYRIYRLGQERPVTIRDYVAANTVDAGKRELLKTKVDRQLRHLSAAALIPYV
jgi:SNF2 family DNA or RNA helicase